MTAVDQLLARARLHHDPDVPDDTVGYEDCAYPDLTPDGTAPLDGDPIADEWAAQALHTLCEAVVTSADLASLEFLTDQLPEPPGAWLLGCALYLADVQDGARFWWQFSGGAGHAAASFCLFLYHLARGESHAAAFWHDQTALDAPADSESEPLTVTGIWPAAHQLRFDASIPTVLRVLSRLTPSGSRPRTQRAEAITTYVARAVTHGYARHPGVEIPVPETSFANRLTFILSVTPPWTQHDIEALNPALPNRKEAQYTGVQTRNAAIRGAGG